MEIEYSNFQLDEATFGKFELCGIVDKHYDFIYNRVYDIRKPVYNANMKAKTYLAVESITNKKMYNQLLDEFEIQDSILSKRMRNLSSSELAKILILKLCLSNAKVIILDHIDGYLNNRDLSNILAGIKRYSDNIEKTVLFRTNHIDNIVLNCTRYIVVRDGKIIYNGNDLEKLPEKSLLMEFVDKANEKKAKIQYYKEPNDLLKAIYRSVSK